jgi:hypothetical protein
MSTRATDWTEGRVAPLPGRGSSTQVIKKMAELRGEMRGFAFAAEAIGQVRESRELPYPPPVPALSHYVSLHRYPIHLNAGRPSVASPPPCRLRRKDLTARALPPHRC